MDRPRCFRTRKFIRLADNPGELIDNRRGQPELLASPDLALEAMVADGRQPRVRPRQDLGG